MKKIFPIILLILNTIAYAAANSASLNPSEINYSKQLLVVTTKNWNAVNGQMQRYERKNKRHSWKAVGAPIPIVVGKNGLAWNPALKQEEKLKGPTKREGDLRAPAGVFAVGPAFGFAPGYIKNIKLPYTQLIGTSVCVDDPNSKFYNQLLNTDKIHHPDWRRSEQMRQMPEYLWGINIAYNTPQPVVGNGSCVFMHIWKQPSGGMGTEGCVAMAEPNVEELLTWLTPAKKPLIVMMPLQQYKTLQKNWHMPATG